MRWTTCLVVALCLACGLREPEAPNVCPYLLPDDPAAAGYDEALRAIQDEFLGRTDFVVRCGEERYPLHLISGELEPKRFRPRGRCRTVLSGHEYGSLEHEDAVDQCYNHEMDWFVDGTEDGRFSVRVRSIQIGIDLARDPDGQWTAKASTCERRPPVCAALQRGGCEITASRPGG